MPLVAERSMGLAQVGAVQRELELDAGWECGCRKDQGFILFCLEKLNK